MATTPAIVVLGDVVTDVVVRHAGAIAAHSDTRARITLGGGGAGGNVAMWLRTRGADVGLVTRVGEDVAGRAAVNLLSDAGVVVAAVFDRVAATGTVVALVDAAGERSMVTDRGASARMHPADLPAAWWRTGAHLHVSGYVLFDGPGRRAGALAMRRAADAGMTISIDPASWSPLAAYGAARFRAATAAAGLVLPNADEARVLTGAADPRVAARLLGSAYGEAVVTCGADGAVWSDGFAVLQQQAKTAAAVVDTTGAGDAFVAGLLAARAAGADPREALVSAVSTACLAVRAPGARPAVQRSPERVLRPLRSTRR